jgi:molybdopterin molybdotransferase
VRIDYNEKGQVIAIPAKGHGSGDLANLIEVDGYLLLPQGKELFKKGEVYNLFIYR